MSTSTAEEGVETIVDLLDGTSETEWSNSPPDVTPVSEVTRQEMENDPNPNLYVWSPISHSYEQFDAEGSMLDVTQSVEVQVWTMTDSETAAYYRDVVNILSGYMRDNYEQTEWHQIEPDEGNDYRSQKSGRQADQSIATLQLDLSDLRPVG